MSDSSYFDDAFDSEFLDQVDALETEQEQEPRVSAPDMRPPTPPKSFSNTNDASSTRPRAPSRQNSDPFEEILDLDDLEEIDNALAHGMSGLSNPPAKLVRTASKTLQSTLWSGVVPESHAKSGTTSRMRPSGGPTPKVKIWDKTAFAKSGWKAIKPTAKTDVKAKGKGRAKVDEDEEGGEEVLLLDTPDIPECMPSEPADLLLIFL